MFPPDPVTELPVVYSPSMVAKSTRSYAVSAEKPRHVAEALRAKGWPLRWVEPVPAEISALTRVHDPAFVAGVLDLSRTNGFGDRSRSVARSLRYTCGALHTGAELALRSGISASLTSGFHHAGYAGPRGYCTFNGLAASAAKLLDDGLVQRVAIVDCDYHYGDGTADILDRLGLGDRVLHESFGEHFKRPEQSGAYLEALASLRPKLAAFAPQIVLYQAGADTHVEDPLGGLLTTEQMRARDRSVFQMARDLALPLTWNLAGGYQQEPDGTIPRVVQLHLDTFEEALAVWSMG